MDKAEALNRLAALPPVQPGQSYVIDHFRPEDALGVARLYYTVYGDSYPVDTPYIPERFIQETEHGDIFCVLARTPSGDILGAASIYRSSPPNPGCYEIGQTLILPEYRLGRIFFLLYEFTLANVLTDPRVEATFSEAVCHHLTTQKLCLRLGMLATALELNLMPAEAYAQESLTGRTSCLIFSRVERSGHALVHAPQRYAQDLALLYQGLCLDRSPGAPRDPEPDSACSLKVERFPMAGVVRGQLATVGEDLDARLDRLESGTPDVAQVYVNLADPGCPWAVERLAARGYFLGGLCPAWFGPDGLLLQKLAQPPDFGGLQIFTDRGLAVRDMVRADYTRLTKAGGAPR